MFSVIKALSPDFFIFNGDQVYADGECKSKGPDDVTGWHNIPGNFSSISDKSVNWSDANKVPKLMKNTGITTGQTSTCRAY